MNLDFKIHTALLLVEEWAERMETPTPTSLDVYLRNPQDLVPAVTGLRVKRLGYLSAVTGLDPGLEEENLEVLYHFCTGPVVITLHLLLPKCEPIVPSLCEIVPSAEPFERELSEMFGVTIMGIRNPDRLYLPEDWAEGIYPLRKDYDPRQARTQA
jgi:Ni,Fe-hydrogenase III component G